MEHLPPTNDHTSNIVTFYTLLLYTAMKKRSIKAKVFRMGTAHFYTISIEKYVARLDEHYLVKINFKKIYLYMNLKTKKCNVGKDIFIKLAQ